MAVTKKKNTNNIQTKFGKRIRELREALQLTREELAERAGLSVQNIAKIENGDRFIAADSLARMAEALGHEERDLFDFGKRQTDAQPALKKLQTILNNRTDKQLTFAHDILARVFKEFG